MPQEVHRSLRKPFNYLSGQFYHEDIKIAIWGVLGRYVTIQEALNISG
jgi:hypothetical protein